MQNIMRTVLPLLLASCTSAATLVPVTVHSGAALPGLSKLTTALSDSEATAILLTLSDDKTTDAITTSSGSAVEEARAAAAAARRAVEASALPVIAVADGRLSGECASIFFAAPYRLCTSKTVFSVDSCLQGETPSLAALQKMAEIGRTAPHIALATALGALELRANDLIELSLATHFAPREALADLHNELKASPSDYYDVPLSRRCSTLAPGWLVPLYAAEKAAPLYGALFAAFGPDVGCLSQLIDRLDAQRKIATEHATRLANEPCGIHIRTRERADAVRDALDAAGDALSVSCPTALEATFAAMRAAAEGQPLPAPVRRASSSSQRTSS